ncbi:MAG: helix-turn-helix domain-containing protein [Alysiella sp.]|uniref:helix-turn-helix domain-containing protein n=1 Tax=Alysiella sp. TaxID=1872483 RepID=UPI0026DB07D4|nr:helix-turn-helix domain-containing protein [Alysiella sp.]MDO4433808.1 helix-turn-helix domain-containing protein [Alysiella sp.]
MNIHERIKQARIQKGLTLQDIGDKLGVTAQSVRQWEIDGMPRPQKIELLADILDVNPSWLQFGHENQPNQNNEINKNAYSFDIFNENIKKQAFEIIEYYGITPEQMFNMILHQIARTQSLPLNFNDLNKNQKE